MKSEKIVLTADNILANHHEIANQSDVLFDGVNMQNTGFPWKGGIAVPTEVVLPGTNITGQLVIIDLKGLVRVDEIKIFDSNGQPTVSVYTALDVFEPKHIVDLELNWYGGFKQVPIGEEIRYILLNNAKGSLTGFGEVEVWGEYVVKDEEIEYPYFPGKKVKDVVGVNSHDYDHVPSSDTPGLANIKDINPTLNWRLYCELHKNVKPDGTINITDPAPGGLTIQDAIDAKERGGNTMLSPVQNIGIFMNSYPDHIPYRSEVPFYVWDKEKTFEENREDMYNPKHYSEIRDIYVKIVQEIKDKAPDTLPHIILQSMNEVDKTWRTRYQAMNAFQIAAMHSMIWDGHEGKYGKGLKDIAPELRIAWLSQAYNNISYTKMAGLWFKKHRSDGEFCADIICANAYCTSISGTQHAEGAYGITPENTFWEEQLDAFYQFSRSIGREFAITEFGYDSNGSSKNSVSVVGSREAMRSTKEFAEWNDWAKWYDTEYWPVWKDKLLAQQARWDLRSILITLKYCDYSFIYHIRDEGPEGSQVSEMYRSCGIAFNRLNLERGQLELKPSGIAIRDFINSLGDYTPVNMSYSDGYALTYFENPQGKVDKVITWELKNDGTPVIKSVFTEPENPDEIDPEIEKEIHRLEAVLDYLLTEVNRTEQQLESLKSDYNIDPLLKDVLLLKLEDLKTKQEDDAENSSSYDYEIDQVLKQLKNS